MPDSQGATAIACAYIEQGTAARWYAGLNQFVYSVKVGEAAFDEAGVFGRDRVIGFDWILKMMDRLARVR